jgi:hypothetical protein
MSLKLSWNVARQSGRPLRPEDIQRYELKAFLDETAFVVQQPLPEDTSLLVSVSDPGVYRFVLVCVPKRGDASAPAEASMELFDETIVVIPNFTIEVVSP